MNRIRYTFGYDLMSAMGRVLFVPSSHGNGSRPTPVRDMETTGLGPDAEICEIALIDQNGTALLETLIKSTILIPRDAVRIHGITNAAVRGEPAFEAWPIIAKLLAARTVVMYNSDFDLRLIRQSFGARRGAGNSALGAIEAQYAMLLYARYHGE